ncbi:hypothetical protein C7446_1845 [Kushneria sinocarnis]|uniref:Uncharacterized protein n=1 Tax=Kushneria sinocarnis TaxID=595502 RepID=A0A420WW32_9GAMM|nr:hypothetical protein C7446_1845 [Kushneria sinocarnis]
MGTPCNHTRAAMRTIDNISCMAAGAERAPENRLTNLLTCPAVEVDKMPVTQRSDTPFLAFQTGPPR